MDVKHEPLRIKHPKHVRVPSEGRYDEVQEEDQEDKEDQGPLPDQDADAHQHAQDVPQQEDQLEALCLMRVEMFPLLAGLPLPLGGCSGHL